MDDESNEAMRDYADFTIDFLQASRKRFENELDEMRKYKDSKEEFLDERIHEDAERTAQIELMNFTMNKGYNRFKRLVKHGLASGADLSTIQGKRHCGTSCMITSCTRFIHTRSQRKTGRDLPLTIDFGTQGL